MLSLFEIAFGQLLNYWASEIDIYTYIYFKFQVLTSDVLHPVVPAFLSPPSTHQPTKPV